MMEIQMLQKEAERLEAEKITTQKRLDGLYAVIKSLKDYPEVANAMDQLRQAYVVDPEPALNTGGSSQQSKMFQ